MGVDKNKIFGIMSEKKERRKMGMMTQSDCCNEPMSGSQIDHEICPKCGEHCTVVFDRSEEPSRRLVERTKEQADFEDMFLAGTSNDNECRIVSFAQQRRADRLRNWKKESER